MSRRAGMATAIVVLWLAGLGVLARRELFKDDAARLAAAAQRVQPGAEFYAVYQGDAQIGFASSTIDTTQQGITLTDHLVVDVEADRDKHRGSAKLTINLSRGLRLRGFLFELSPEIGPLRAVGDVSDDSTLKLSLRVGDEQPDVQTLSLGRPLLLPNLVPLMLALSQRPRVGRSYTFSVFNPLSMAPEDVTVDVKAESTFVVSDSATVDERSRRWVPARFDTVQAWRVEQRDGGLAGWVDARGRMVEASYPGNLLLRRTAYEIAFSNWQRDARANGPAGKDRDIQETTAIAASVPIGRRRQFGTLRVRLRDASLDGFDLDGGRQRMRGDTLQIRREAAAVMRASYALPADSGSLPSAARPYLRAEKLLQVDDPAIRETAARIVAGESDPAAAARRLTQWVHDSLEKKISFSIPNAAQILRVRRGDCNEHTQLYVALARAAGLPARSAAGLAYVGGKFYYHAWPEVYLGDWVAVDPTFGQFPADAAHLRFVIGGFSRQTELLRLIGSLQIDVVTAR